MIARSTSSSPPALALAWCSGIALARVAGPLSATSLPWLALAIGVASVGRGRVVLLACAVLVGAAAGAHYTERDARRPVLVDVVPDDRGFDVVAGRVVGAVVDERDRRRFDLELAPPRAGTVRLTTSRNADVVPGDELRVRARLRTPRGYRNPGSVDAWRRARDRGHQLVGFVRPADLQRLARRGGVHAWATRLQRRIAARIDARSETSTPGGIVAAMVIGDRAGIDDELRERFAAAGLAHVLAVSGLHLAVTAMLVFGVVRRGWALVPPLCRRAQPAVAAAAASLPVAALYTLATGARTSTVRALVVVTVVLVGVALRRRVALADSLAVAALALSATHPPVVFDPGFQLSFAATAALALLLARRGESPDAPPVAGTTGPLMSGARRVARALRDSAAVSLAVAPITAVHFGAVALGGIVANVVALPLAELFILPIGLVGAALGEVGVAPGDRLIDLALLGARGLDGLAELTARLAPPVRLGGAAAVLASCVAFALVLAASGRLRRWRGPWAPRSRWWAALALVFVGVAAVVTRGAETELRVTFIDVGQGDAALVEMPGGAAWLVDGGGLPFVVGAVSGGGDDRRGEMPGARAVMPLLRARGVDRIAVAVVSHPHPDHYLGLRAVARSIPIDELWVAAPHAEQPWPAPFAAFVAELRARGTRVVAPRPGPRRVGPAVVDVLAPRFAGGVAVDPVHSANDNSIALSVAFAGRRILFAGDLEGEGEQLVVARSAARLAADVVKVPHHGSRTSSSPALVAAVAPVVAVVSCGLANRFGFPARSVVERWTAEGARVLRTDEAGAVTVRVSPSGELRVASFDTTAGLPAQTWTRP